MNIGIYIYIATNNMPLASDSKSTCIFVHNFIFHMILRVSTVVSPPCLVIRRWNSCHWPHKVAATGRSRQVELHPTWLMKNNGF